ncbi:E3 ubiquitin-protein ligase TRIM39-like isoform X2 [Ambystoma mexicanum]|uniref:E3 ubiquitin-protein ligase TRIM39-like isoform X2 n=1 Tax=Ambystoma mexicanum TaxID=8296 RepID=UPI0037E991DE
MAAAAQLQGLKEEATCSICLEYFTEPVSVECGHAFCLPCITKCWEGLETNFPCPQCRETSQSKTLRPNRQLGNMVEMLKQFPLPNATPQEENLCSEHEEKLKLFCEDDQRPICVVCSMSRDHKPHTVLPIREAAQDYKDKLYSHMEHLKKEVTDLKEWIEEESRKASELKGNIMKQREKILSIFEHLKQFLEQEKQQLLSRLEKEQEENVKKIQEKLTRLEKQQSTHRDLLTQLERRCQQQDVDLLKDVKSVLGRCSAVNTLKPQEDASAIKRTLQSTRRHAHLWEKLTELKETFPAEMAWRCAKSCEREVTLDPSTAHPELIVSKDGRSVRRGDRAQALPDTPQRFTRYCCVLGSEGLSSGGHYWEVEVGGSTDWALGVCDESVPRKEWLTLSPERGLWTVRLWDGKYQACTSPTWTPLTPRAPPGVLGFFLDYEAGRFSFYDAQDRALLFTFPRASFPRTLRPYFYTWRPEAELRIHPGAGRD